MPDPDSLAEHLYVAASSSDAVRQALSWLYRGKGKHHLLMLD
jgi:hypothetical protein